MKAENISALVVGYFLSRFNERAYQVLGYGTQTATHEGVAGRLGVRPALVKNMRDQFDSVHENPRVGWYQRPLPPSRQRVLEMLQALGFSEVHAVVQDVLAEPRAQGSTAELLAGEVEHAERNAGPQKRVYTPRALTGRRAEELFLAYHRRTGEPVPGNLVDTRDLGCGYDFRIEAPERTVYVEVKGLDGSSGGMLFTAREWETAIQMGPDYYVALVRNAGADSSIEFYQDPSSVLPVRQSITTVVQVRWLVSVPA